MLASLADRMARLEALAGTLARLLGVAPGHLIQRLMLSPNYHAAAGQVAEELRVRCLPVPVWIFTIRDGRHVWISTRGAFTLQVLDTPDPDSKVGWHVSVDVAPEDGWGGPETGETGKVAAEAAWRRVCGVKAANLGA